MTPQEVKTFSRRVASWSWCHFCLDYCAILEPGLAMILAELVDFDSIHPGKWNDKEEDFDPWPRNKEGWRPYLPDFFERRWFITPKQWDRAFKKLKQLGYVELKRKGGEVYFRTMDMKIEQDILAKFEELDQ